MADIKKYKHDLISWLSQPVTIIIVYLLLIILVILKDVIGYGKITALILFATFIAFTAIIIYFYTHISSPLIKITKDKDKDGIEIEKTHLNVRCNIDM